MNAGIFEIDMKGLLDMGTCDKEMAFVGQIRMEYFV